MDPGASSQAWRSVRNDGGCAARSGSAAASWTNESASDATTLTSTIAPMTMTGTITAMTASRAWKVRQPALQPVGDRRDEERQQPREEEDQDDPEVVLEVASEEPEDDERRQRWSSGRSGPRPTRRGDRARPGAGRTAGAQSMRGSCSAQAAQPYRPSLTRSHPGDGVARASHVRYSSEMGRREAGRREWERARGLRPPDRGCRQDRHEVTFDPVAQVATGPASR